MSVTLKGNIVSDSADDIEVEKNRLKEEVCSNAYVQVCL